MDSANNKNDYQFESYESYYGDIETVKRIIEECPNCQAKMVFSHFSDNGNLMVHETSRCVDCDFGQKKVIHVLN